MKQTSKYQLNLIESGDPFLADPINENTQALEDALISHNSDSTAHTELQAATANHVADKSNPHGVTAEQVGAAASSHSHAASSIISGTLPVARGGTGNTSVDTAPTSGSTKMVTSGGIYTALAGKSDTGHTHSGYAAGSHDHSAANITSGTLAVARGGTGNTSVDTAPISGSTKMVTSGGVYTALAGKAASSHDHSAANITSGTLAVARGGTGNTSVDTAPTSGSTKMVTSGGVYTALSKKHGSDNLPWVFGTYTGTGVNADDTQEISLGFRPSALFVMGNSYGNASDFASCGIAVRSGDTAGSISSVNSLANYSLSVRSTLLSITDNGFSVMKYSSTTTRSLNESGGVYVYMAFK